VTERVGRGHPIAARRAIGLITSVALIGAAGCTHWNSRTTYAPPQELTRRLVGAPQVAETTSASLSAGLAGSSANGATGTSILGGLSANAGSLKRTHCVQEAQIDFVQPYEVAPVASTRAWDWVGAITIGVIGLSVVNQARANAADDRYYGGRQQSYTGTYVFGGALIAGGIGWIGYSQTRLPHQPAPPVQHLEKRWTESRFVETTGCGLVPSDVAKPSSPGPAPADAEARLKELDRLHQSGILSDEEYARKRKAVIDAL
jgi:hypothetical protein